MAEAVVADPLNGLRRRRRKKTLFISGMVVVAAAAGVYGYLKMNERPAMTPVNQTVQVQRGDVSKTLEVTGTVEASKEINLNFTSSDDTKLTEVNVKVGDVVKAGQVLARLDSTDARQAVREAEANLEVAKANLTEAQETATAAEIAQQQASVDKAELALEAAKNSTEVQSVKMSLDKAKKALASAQQELEDQQYLYDADAVSASELKTAQDAADNAQDEYDSALLQYNNTVKSNEQSIKEAQISYNSAAAQMEELMSPPKETSLVQAKSSVQQAETKLAQSKSDLEKLVLTAPWDGVILQVNGDVGTAPESPFIVMNNSSSAMLNVSAPVSESDIGSIEVGQTAAFVTDTYPDETFEGKVTSISPEATTDSGVTTYEVNLSITNKDGMLKTGMTMDVTIHQGTHENVLYIPGAALISRGDRDGVMLVTGGGANSTNQNGGSTDRQAVQRGSGGIQFTPVEVGYYTADKVEITSGLSENDTITIPAQNNISSSSSNSQGQRSIMGGGGFSGGGGGFPGGGRPGGR
ncbi:efflux RND transporter periplasmic adaptor subunit [Paenibacillus macerans]|uniref:efflux RND transporter periplasmic adaptor subunit n=1 Tax=Paenibacillus macerans TaxID=44252 RepID=UPI0020407C5E|nr:efflux RND transporter periplasmic adaptor subunit [Paenibacillus macerans]MCM3702491.1 efflux RND transporter periplasmic adaptor subunit [Paenibacillus macerans]